MKGSFRLTVGAGDAEGPVLDLVAAGVPIIRPGEDECAGQTHQEGLPDVAGQELRLFLLAVPERVHADLPQEQRLIADEVLEAEQVAAKGFQIVQVDVESQEVEG